MKIKIAMFLLIIVASGKAQWFTQNDTLSQSLGGIFLLNSQEGWVVGDKGIVYHLTSAGYHWEAEKGLPVSENFNDVSFVSAADGWCVGTNGSVYKRNQQGTWNQLNSPTALYLCGISTISGSNQNIHLLWISGFSRTILHSSNSGVVLNFQNSTIGSAYRDITFIDQNRGWIVGNSGVIIRTTNGGFSWSEQLSSGITVRLYGLYFANPDYGWAVGQSGTIIATTDGGSSWFSQSSPTTERLNAITGIDPLHLIAVGENGTVILTSNGGNTWIAESGFTSSFNDAAMIDTENYWIVGENGANYYSEGTIQFSEDSIASNERFEIGDTIVVSFETTFNSFVDIHYSLSGGNNWILVKEGLQAYPGSYNWIVPSTTSTDCRLRIRSTTKPQVETISEPFKIFKKSLNITAPMAGDTLIGGEIFTIRWQESNVTTVSLWLKINLTPDSVIIGDNVTASDEQYEWEVERVIQSNKCQIRIFETDGDGPGDISGPFTIAFDPDAPVIMVDVNSIEPIKGQDLLITATITDNNPTINHLLYRMGGDTTYRSQKLISSGVQNEYNATIQAREGDDFAINERGLEFFIRSKDTSPDSNIRVYYTDENPQYLPVILDSLHHEILSSTPGKDIYQMISIPYKLDDTQISAVLDDLGPYDPHKWRLWMWLTEDEDYGEFTKVKIGDFSQGRSFWLAAVKDKFYSGAGQSFKPDTFSIDLDQGWNQIGHPFAFTVLTEDIFNTSGSP
ncbi:MAG: hypothetical protein JSV84_00670 [Gemmatimonadota bacterium]|nr:MAG: hypothetical protein JSV84_00670 [Gemmatimonadota bacterium]